MIKIDFKKIKPKKFLVYDAVSLPLIDKLIKKKDYNIYYNRYESINFWILLKTLLKFDLKNLKINYKINYIKDAGPRAIITYIDNNPSFYNLKKIFPKIKMIAIQNGNRTKEDFDKFKNYKNLQADYFFVFSRPVANEFKNYIKSNYIVSGSIKCNFIKKIKIKRKKEILFISQHNKLENIKITEKTIILLLQKIKEKYKINFKILLKKNLKKVFLNEFSFLNEDNFLKHKNVFSSYKHIQEYKLVIFINSTLGYEALAMDIPVLALPLGSNSASWCKKNKIRKPEKFGYPKKLPENGFCWTNKFNKKLVTKKILKIFQDQKISKKRQNLIIKDIMYYDYQNKKIKKLLKEI